MGNVGTVLANPYRMVTTNERYVEVYFEKIKETMTVDIKALRKVRWMEFHNLQIYKDRKITTESMFYKLQEEAEELAQAIASNNNNNLADELLDVIQCCVGIAFTRNINLDEYIKVHNKKLSDKGYMFLD